MSIKKASRYKNTPKILSSLDRKRYVDLSERESVEERIEGEKSGRAEHPVDQAAQDGTPLNFTFLRSFLSGIWET
ncbi:hypothetical protein TNCV_1961291 [Trichonephila clavipes]|nr:hypothetical protein TNCV_1961291 [Trichonephila clavipes]